MSTANTSALRVSDLDFFSIRNNLKDFLRSQDTFTDYDFEGSGMSVLLDILAYNTYYNSFYLNMVANESFLDTAQLRQNILSHAKMINYIPTSKRAASARIDAIATPSPNELRTLNVATLDKYTRLTGVDSNGIPFPFVTIDSTTAQKDQGRFYFANVAIKQGQVITKQFLCQANNAYRRFDLGTANVDTTTLLVTVQESASNTYTRDFKISQDMTEINANSFVYFVEENERETWTLYFGDGILGYRPKDGNIVQVTYIDTLGGLANDIVRFSFVDPIAGLYKDNISVVSLQKSYGGSEREDIDKIRFYAPQYYSAQNRAVTVDDYESIIAKNYTNIDGVSVWGGEDNDPPVYGKVFISLKTKGFYALTNVEKEMIKNDLIKTTNVVTVTPELVDPDFLYIIVKGRVTYNPNLTTKSAQQLLGIVRNAVSLYAQEELNTFKSTFRKSKLQNYIEDSDPSITGSDIEIIVQKRITLTTQKNIRYNIPFDLPLERSDFVNNRFYTFPSIGVIDSNLTFQNTFVGDIPNSNTGIASITVNNQGYGYIEPPAVLIEGDGVGANAYAVLSADRLSRIVVDRPGRNYTKATVSLIAGGGQFASATATLEENMGTLETYYITNVGDKIVIDPNAGSINYETGKTVLFNLAAQTVSNNAFYANGVVTFNGIPSEEIISPNKNRVPTIDVNNAQSIQINMVAHPE